MYQRGFWKNTSTTNRIFTPRYPGKALGVQPFSTPIVCRILQSDYDFILINRMYKITAHEGILTKYIRLIKICLQGSKYRGPLFGERRVQSVKNDQKQRIVLFLV